MYDARGRQSSDVFIAVILVHFEDGEPSERAAVGGENSRGCARRSGLHAEQKFETKTGGGDGGLSNRPRTASNDHADFTTHPFDQMPVQEDLNTAGRGNATGACNYTLAAAWARQLAPLATRSSPHLCR